MHRIRRSLLGTLAFLALVSSRALASGPRYDDILPISQVKAGMTGYGLTVFRGTVIEHFEVTVVGVVKKGSLIVPGHDMILVKMAGGPMTERQANLIRGMSGSPVYVNGKIIGAFSQGEPTTKEPLGGVTPIEDMLEAWDPKLPDSPLSALPDNRIRTVALKTPIQAGGRRITKIVYNTPLKSGLRSHGTTLVLHPCTTFATFSGLSKTAREKIAKVLEPYNVEVLQGVATGGQKSGFKGSPLVPGAAMSMMLVTGDLTVGATGTVTYRRDNRILAFGHPFMGIGPIDAPLCSAWIYDVYPLLSGSYKISSPGPIIGSSSQDRNFAISGVIGKMPKTIPVLVDVKDLTTGRHRTIRAQVVGHPNLYSAMVSASVGSAISEVRSTPGAAIARVVTTVDAEEIGKVTRTNTVFDMRGIDGAATADLDDLLSICTSNPFYPLVIKSAEVKVEIESGHQTAQVERIFLKEGRFEPGETAEVGVVIKPYKQPPVTKTVKLAIPQNTPTGRYVLQVKGGGPPPSISIGGFIIRQQTGQNSEQAPPVSIRQMVNRYNEREKNNEIVARILLPTTAVNVEGERLSGLPPALDAILRSSKSSGVKLERDEVKVVEPVEWVITGQQLLAINVQRKEVQEGPSGTSGSSGGSGGGASSGSSVSFDREFDAHSDIDSPSPSMGGRDRGMGASGEGFTTQSDPQTKSAPKPARDSKSTGKGKKPAEGEQGGAPSSPAGAPPAAPTPANETPVARAPQVWRQTTRADFAAGEAHGVSVTTHGDLCLARALKKFQTSTESFLNALEPDGQGGLFAGTGTQGRILHLSASGETTMYARLPEVMVHSLCRAPDGTLFAGTGPYGRTYKIAPDGAFAVVHDAKEKYVLALARDSKGNLYIGAGGGGGTIYRLKPNRAASVFFQTPEEHVTALTVDAADNLYAGTSSGGILYRITPDGRASVLYDAPEPSITAVGVNSKGMVYAATAPRGVLYCISQDGTARTLYDKAAAGLTALRIAPDDTVYVGGGSALYAVQPDDTVTSLDNRTDVEILALAVQRDGTVYAGTGSVAEVYAVALPQGKQSGAYESVVHDAKRISRWGAIRWNAAAPAGTRLEIQTRTGNDSEPDSTWSPWAAPRPEADGGRVTSPPARFIQYRVALFSDTPDRSPALRDIAITYLPRNQAPKVAFQAPAGGERWARQQTVKWEASDPDKDTLNYELYYSADNGAHWTLVPGAPTPGPSPNPGGGIGTAAPPSETGATAPPAAKKPAGKRPPTMEEVTAELDKHPDLPTGLREAIIARARVVNAEFDAGPGGPSASPAVPAAAPAATRETTRSLDTKTLPDGTYLLKVVASDRPSNPTEALTAEVVSDPFVVCNAPPTLYVLKSTIQVQADRTVSVEGTALQKMIVVTAVQYRVDSGEWNAAVPADGIFDGAAENFTFTTAPLAKGSHTIEVKAFNAANVTTTEKVTVEVK